MVETPDLRPSTLCGKAMRKTCALMVLVVDDEAPEQLAVPDTSATFIELGATKTRGVSASSSGSPIERPAEHILPSGHGN